MPEKRYLLALTLVCLCLLVVIVVLHQHDKRSHKATTLLDPDSVQRMEIRAVAATDQSTETPAAASPYALTQRQGHWWLSDENSYHTAVRASSQRVTPLLQLLHLPQRQSYALAEVDPAELGLDPPRASVTIEQLLFTLGDATADGQARYVEVNERVYLYPEFVYPLLRAGREAFIARGE